VVVKNIGHAVTFTLTIGLLLVSFLALPVFAPDVIETPSEVTVVQGDVFLLRHKMYFNEPASEGNFAFVIYWENLTPGGLKPDENFSLENWSIYRENGEPLDNLEVISEPTLRGWKIIVTCWSEWGDGVFYVDLWLRAASGDGTPHRPIDHLIIYSANSIMMRESSLVIVPANPITVRVFSSEAPVDKMLLPRVLAVIVVVLTGIIIVVWAARRGR
jgi:hypothetical protein